EEFWRAKALMPHLNDVADRAAPDLLRQQFQKRREIRRVECLERRELPQEGAELAAEFGEAAAEKPLDTRPGLGEIAAALRHITRPLQRKDEILRRLVMPFLEARRCLRPVESAVDLDRGAVPAG